MRWLIPVLLVLLVLAIVVVLTPAPQAQDTGENASGNNVSIIYITMDECTNCYSASMLLGRLDYFSGPLGLNITNRTVGWDSEEGSSLISRYNITKLPALIISKEAGSSIGFLDAWDRNSLGTQEGDGSYVMRNPAPPFYDAKAREFVGQIYVTEIVNSECGECLAPDYLYNYLWRAGIPLANVTTVEYSSDEGGKLLVKYNITRLPAAILTKDAGAYRTFEELWSHIGEAGNDAYVFKEPFPPYYDIEKKGVINTENE